MEHGEDLVGSARTATDRPDRPVQQDTEDVGANVAPAAGGAAGAVAGGTAGTLVAGPVGTVIGAIAGAVGGWWMGAAARSAIDLTPEDESYYRARYEAAPRADWRWDRVRPAYALGDIAATNPDYAGRSFDEVERDLEHGWQGETRTTHGEWAAVREMVRAAYERRSTAATVRRADESRTTDTHPMRPADASPSGRSEP
jgi:hypothetical protein